MFWKKKGAPPSAVTSTEDDGTEKYFLKLTLMGDGAVGKTNLRRRYLGQGFSSDHMMTIGADFAATDRELQIGDTNFSITYQIWDLAGQATFNQVRSMYYRGCFGALMVFDITRPSSFNNIEGWINELKKHSGRGQVPMVILGNKYDLVDEAENVVSEDQIKGLIDKLNSGDQSYEISYLNTSALTGLNVDEAFERLGTNILHWLGVVE